MRKHLLNLFVPHHGNNHKPKILHHESLSKLVILLLFVQLLITGVARVKPGVLGYASNISIDQILSLTNSNRQSSGLANLSLNATLSDSARRKAADMFAKNYWAHNAPDGTTPWAFFKAAGYNYLYAGENLARDFGDSESVVRAWMDSQTHRDNIMSGRYTEIGIAVVNGTLNGQETTLVVQHFGMPSAVAPAIPVQAAAEPAPVKPVATAKPIMTVEPTAQATTLVVVAETERGQSTPTLNEVSQPMMTTYVPSNYQSTPVISAFDLTKSINIALAMIILGVLALDGYLIMRRGTVRRSGKSFVHFALFTVVVLIIILTTSGKII